MGPIQMKTLLRIRRWIVMSIDSPTAEVIQKVELGNRMGMLDRIEEPRDD